MVIILGKQYFFTTPPSFPGPKCRGEILIYIPGQKRYLFPGKNLKIISPPATLQKYGAKISGQNLWAKIVGQKYSLRFSHIWPFLS